MIRKFKKRLLIIESGKPIKNNCMKRGLIPQEILLATATIFFQKRLSEKIASENSCLSYIGKLEEACRNGVLDNMLPESMEKSTTGKTLFTWDIR